MLILQLVHFEPIHRNKETGFRWCFSLFIIMVRKNTESIVQTEHFIDLFDVKEPNELES